MTHPNPQVRFEPSRSRTLQARNRADWRSQCRRSSCEFIVKLLTECQKGHSGILETLRTVAPYMGKWSTLAVALKSEQDKLALHDIFDLEPVLRWSAPVAARSSLGDNSLEGHASQRQRRTPCRHR
jgi:hypothetical protein